jgi:GNAT superfamily N-acetyltransferase
MRQFQIGQLLIEIRQTEFTRIVDLRHAILRTGMPREAAIFAGDDAPATRHYGAFTGERNVGCATFHLNEFEGVSAWQLRGMATDAGLRGKGVGAALLRFGEEELLAASPERIFWCNARTPAVPFYEKQGWWTCSDEFIVETAGPHYKMVKRI